MQEHLFDDPLELASSLAESVADDLRNAVECRDAASLVVSGGSTPRPFFERLRRQSLDWPKVWVTLADERWVPVDHEASNERLVRQGLHVGAASAARLMGLKTPHATPEEGCEACERALSALPRPFDIVVLGMGGDGHTASLFPGAKNLAVGLDPQNPSLCLPIHPPDAPHPRLSLTLSALVAARRLILHITGESKWQVYQRALEAGPVDELPIRAVLRHASEPVEVYWAP